MQAVFEQRIFRDALGYFPTGVAIVTASAINNAPVAMTISSFNAVSLDPPLVLFSVSRTAPSLGCLLSAENFCISVLRDDQQDISAQCASGLPEQWSRTEPASGRTGCPVIGDALARFECSLHATHDGGDHVIIVGRVLAFDHEGDGGPLIFYRGHYRAIKDSPAAIGEVA